jgi:mannose-6-phosphate isomerase-like protein (cupin superfamily)
MGDVKKILESGILEEYVLGFTSAEENLYIDEMSKKHAEIELEIVSITNALVKTSENIGPKPSSIARTSVFATIDLMERLQSGETLDAPPILNENSTIEDYSKWLNDPEIFLPEDYVDSYAKIIGANPEATTMIVWLNTGAPYEKHDNEYERFLIVEGSCDIDIHGEIHSLKVGDYIQIPLHLGHSVKVTSSCPCKVLLQRVAA